MQIKHPNELRLQAAEAEISQILALTMAKKILLLKLQTIEALLNNSQSVAPKKTPSFISYCESHDQSQQTFAA